MTFKEKFGPRGVIHSWANPDGTQRIEDTGPLTKKRMETVDDETSDAAIEFIERQQAAGKPWFVWWSGTRMHFRTHVSEENMAKAKEIYPCADEYTRGRRSTARCPKPSPGKTPRPATADGPTRQFPHQR